jgi:UDP-glucose 4-epimerase
MIKSEDLGNFYRIPSDNRDLNYDKYFIKGEKEVSEMDDYTSANTKRLNIEEVKKLLLELDYVKDEIAGRTGEVYA